VRFVKPSGKKESRGVAVGRGIIYFAAVREKTSSQGSRFSEKNGSRTEAVQTFRGRIRGIRGGGGSDF